MGYGYFQDLEYFLFDSFRELGVNHAFYTRKGGVSPEPWHSLNLGGTVGDLRPNVVENRRRIFEHFKRPVESLFDVWQVHGDTVVKVDSPRPLDEPHTKADAMITDHPEITLFMRFADCVPVILADPEKGVIGMVHAGWQGTVKQVASKTIRAMVKTFGSSPQNIRAGIGPSIGPDHYVVGQDVIHQVTLAMGNDADRLILTSNGTTRLDLWAANELQLRREGVESIEIAGLCTACDTSRWFSHRAEKGKTGRFAALMAITPDKL